MANSSEVIWRQCADCGREWPFPKGPQSDMVEQFHCAVCYFAKWAALERKSQESK